MAMKMLKIKQGKDWVHALQRLSQNEMSYGTVGKIIYCTKPKDAIPTLRFRG
jgi:hypothetical protein